MNWLRSELCQARHVDALAVAPIYYTEYGVETLIRSGDGDYKWYAADQDSDNREEAGRIV